MSDKERRKYAQELLLEMIDSADPNGVLSSQQDPSIRAEAERLWARHRAAEETGFLNDVPELVRALHSLTSDRTWQPGTRLAGRFVVLEFLGEGGMGEVYLAHDEWLRDHVALKTIRKELLDVPALRKRLSEEVQNARQVTHPNVCRIYDIHGDGEAIFFAMEYLEGKTLSDIFESGNLTPRQAKTVALQLARALLAAHNKKVLHRDFKPGNVILTKIETPHAMVMDFGLARAFDEPDTHNAYSLEAGTPEYMAPELLQGAPATAQSDIYAYGVVLRKLLPGHNLIARLTAADPQQRPASMATVVEALEQPSPAARWTRRALIAGAAAGAGAFVYWTVHAPHVPLGSRQRVIVNGLTGDAPQVSLMGLRNLLLMALGQSPLINVFPDPTLKAALRKHKLPVELPAKLDNLRTIARNEGARLIIDGKTRTRGRGLEVELALFVDAAGEPQYRFHEDVDDARQLTRLAEMAALRLRQECGESAGAIRNSYSPLERATSAVPEAVEYYFQAVHAYELTQVEDAIALLNRAVALDNQFALAHFYLGLAYSALSRTRQGFDSCSRAFELRDRTTPRERDWIESQYYNLCGDRLRALNAYRQNAVLHPDDAIFQRQLAYGYARIGQFDEALKYSQRAVDLDPFSIINRTELIVNLAEAMHYDAALAAYQEYLQQGLEGTAPNWGAGLAHLGKRQYPEAQRLFEALAQTREYASWSRMLTTMIPILEGDLAGAEFRLQGDLAYNIAAGEEHDALDRRTWLGWTQLYRDNTGAALSVARDLAAAPGMPNYIFAWRGAARLGAALKDRTVYEAGLAGLRSFMARYPSTYLSGAIAGAEADWAIEQGDLASAEKPASEAVGLFLRTSRHRRTIFGPGATPTRNCRRCGRWKRRTAAFSSMSGPVGYRCIRLKWPAA